MDDVPGNVAVDQFFLLKFLGLKNDGSHSVTCCASHSFKGARFDPPRGIGRESNTPVGIESLEGLNEPDVALRDQIGGWQAISAIAPRDLGNVPQVAGQELVRSVSVVTLAPARYQPQFFEEDS